MTKRIILSLAMIVLTIAGVTSATMAYFSDTATSTGNTFTAGTLGLTLDETGTIPINLTNMQPGDIESGSMTVENTGSLPGWLGIRSSYVEADNNTGADNVGPNTTAKMLLVTAFTADGNNRWSAIPDVDNDGRITVYDMVNDTTAVAPPHAGGLWYSYDDNMTVDESHVYAMTVQFDPNAGNAYQGDGITWTFEFLLDQQ